MKKPIVILGAGPAGMAAAYELCRAKQQVIVVEKDAQVGGLAKTLRWQEGGDVFRTDIGPHRFFSENTDLYGLIEGLLGDEWKVVDRLTRFYIDGKFYLYPVEIGDTLRNLGLERAAIVARDYAIERIRGLWLKDKPGNFGEYAVRSFGRALAELNVLNYTEKIWGLPSRDLSVDWASQRIRELSAWTAVRNAMIGGGKGGRSMVNRFYYPEYGTGTIYQRMWQETYGRVEYLFGSRPVGMQSEKNRIKSLEVKTPKGIKRFSPQFVISSIPLFQTLNLLGPGVPPGIKDCVNRLRYRSQVYLFITINKPQIFKDQWIYLPQRDIPFGRVSEMKNFSNKMSPSGATSLFVEFFCWADDDVWKSSKEKLLRLCMPFFEQWGWFSESEVRNVYKHRKQYVYPVYEHGYKERLDKVMEFLNGYDNLVLIGRPGRFKYNNQDHSLEMGIMAAKSIIGRSFSRLDDVAADQRYFESGVFYQRNSANSMIK